MTAKPPPRANKKMGEVTAMEFTLDLMYNRDELLLPADRIDMSKLHTECTQLVYTIFRYAHGKLLSPDLPSGNLRPPANICPKRPTLVVPPWRAMQSEEVLDKMYFPPGWKYIDAGAAPKPEQVRLLEHLIGIGHLRFNKYKLKNGKPRDPVSFENRWWAGGEKNRKSAEFEAAKARALAAGPSLYVTPLRNPFEGGTSAAEPAGPADEGAAPAAHGKGKSVVVLSPYGSVRTAKIHSTDLWQADDHPEMPEFQVLVDPDDLPPPAADVRNLDAPSSVPRNPEAWGQWAWKMLESRDWDMRAPKSKLKACITTLAQLPVRRLRHPSALHLTSTSSSTTTSMPPATSARRTPLSNCRL